MFLQEGEVWQYMWFIVKSAMRQMICILFWQFII